MAEFRANTDRMKSGVERLTGYVESINKRVEELIQKKAELDAMWEGEASTAFRTAFQRDIDSLVTMVEQMRRAYQYEDTAKKKYVRCERQISEMISEL